MTTTHVPGLLSSDDARAPFRRPTKDRLDSRAAASVFHYYFKLSTLSTVSHDDAVAFGWEEVPVPVHGARLQVPDLEALPRVLRRAAEQGPTATCVVLR